MTLYGIWRKDANYDSRRDAARGDWLRETDDDPHSGIIAFQTKRAACNRAATLYGFANYTAAKNGDWCEVRPLVPAGAQP